MAGAKEISLDVAMTAFFFSGLAGIFNLKEEHKVKTEDFSFWTILLLSLYCLTNFAHWHQTNSTLRHDSH